MHYDFETLPSRADTGSMKWADFLREAPSAKADIVPFTMADMELNPPPELIEDMSNYLHSAVFGYTGPTEAYFDAIHAWMLRRHQWDVPHETILQSTGVVGAIYSAIRALSEPSDGVIIMPPVYGPFYNAVERTGRRVVKNPLLYRNGHYEIDFDDLQRQASDKSVRILLLCSPHNPVGRVWTRDELTRLGHICMDNGVYVVADEIHHDVVQPGRAHTVFASISEEFAQNSMVCTSPGKGFNLTGIQISNIMIANQGIRGKFRQEQDKTAFYTLNAFAYQACESAYNHCEAWLDALLCHIWSNQLFLKEFLKKNLPRVEPVPLEGTFLQWLDFHAMGLGAIQREKMLRECAQVYLDSGSLFGAEGDDFARMNLACPREVLRLALERMGEALG